MAKFELKLPKMGESVAEATITNWLKEVGDTIAADEAVLEIATEKLFGKDDLVQVGQTIAIIETDASTATTVETPAVAQAAEAVMQTVVTAQDAVAAPVLAPDFSQSDKFYSPLVKNIAKQEGISLAQLDQISGTGKEGRVTKNDILAFIAQGPTVTQSVQPVVTKPVSAEVPVAKAMPVSVNGQDEMIEMDRMRKLISGYMVQSLQTSAHVQSFIEVDVTAIWDWREKNKNAFEKREGEKLTFTPIFMELIARALKDFPMMNISVEGDYIIKKKNINLGMAAALPNGNLIVPVIKNADQLNLLGMAKAVNDLGSRAKAGKLKPDDTHGGTYTVTNVGTFGSVFGTPIINQPQVGILALGAIRKVPAVIETPEGDFIGIRKKMFLSHSYDHRVVDGALGGSFVKRVAEYMEAFDENRSF